MLTIAHLAGCYAYREVQRSDVRDGSSVRVLIQSEEAVRQQAVTGRLAQTLEGVVVPDQPAELLGLTVPQATAGPAEPSFNVFVSLPWSSVLRIEERRFSTVRTLLAGAIGAGLVTGAIVAISTGGTSNGGEDGGSDARIRVPLIRVLVR
jgi:hypothetical protein